MNPSRCDPRVEFACPLAADTIGEPALAGILNLLRDQDLSRPEDA
jgi:hypothetical protein